ncbi:MAG: cadherin-like beta sandwich domain-containing protein, partial [Chromatiales bacterium]|nr:cadherin-like beta sandwich domain-containing protein [Chromatiales bacterium]
MTPFLLVLLIMLWQPVAAQQAPLLSNVNLSDNQGDPIELSQETTTSYKAEVPNAVAQVQVMLTAADPNATITVDNEVIESGRESQFIILAESGVTTITIVVTAEDAMNIYTIAVSRAASSDASLSSLLLTQSNGTLILLAETFAPETTTYTASVKNMIAQVRVMPMASDLNATITVDGRNVFSFNESQPIELAEGEVTTITIVVTAQAGNTNTYTIAVSRQAAPLSSDATLSALTLTDRVNGTSVVGDIDSFSPDKLQYSARVLYIVSTVTVTVSATDIENAEIRVNGAIVASGADIAVPLAEAGASTDIEIVVTAQDRETDNTYTVTVYRVLPPLPRSDATLFDLELVGNGETIDFDFDSMVSTYTVSVAHTVDTIEVIPTANDSFAATIEVNGISVERGDSTEVPLGDVGQSTDIVVIVTAGDGVTMASYTVTVTRELSNDASLSALMLTDTEDNTITLMPAFASMMNNYTAEVANTVAQVRVTPVATEGTMSMISIGNETVASSASISVDLGATGTTTDIEIVVTAPNGMTMNTYTIEVNRAVPPALDDTTLVGLALVENGEPIALDFDSMVSTYTVSVAHTVDNLEVTPTANNSSATIVINGTDATSGESTDVMLGDPGQSTDIVVIVTAADGMTMASYTVTVNRALSNDASLSALMLTDTEDHTIPLMPTFASEETNYTASVGATVAEVRVTPVATGTIATIMVEVAEVQTQVESGSPSNPIPLVAGEVTTITIEVTAQAGNTNTYTIAVNRLAAPPSSDASLSGLTVSAGTLSPDFNSDTQDYTVEVANATATITVTPTATNVNATITVDDEAVVSGSASSAIELAEGEVTTITIVVTAQDGTTNTYTIAVNRAPSSDATLSGLTISAGTLMPTFMSDTLSYTVEVANATPTITVTPVPTNPNATITVNGGSASDPISLAAGEVTTITVVVTAQDDNTMETYTIAVTRLAPPPSSDASLSALEVSAGTLMPPFMSDTLSYTVEVANATPTITVTPTASDANVIEIMVNGERVGSGNASQFIDLAEGDVTEITIVVTAQDSTTNTYTIAVARGGLLPSCTQTIPDTDDDGVLAVLDIDKDGDGLIELCDLEGLNAIRYQLDGSGYRANSTATLIMTGCPSDGDGCRGYELVRSLDFDDARSYGSGRINTAWTKGTGWLPIGSQDQPFNAIFEGNDNTISNLMIDRPADNRIGLFGEIDTNSQISNIGLLDVNIMGNAWVGGLVGNNEGSITNSYAMGDVAGIRFYVGGLVGNNEGSITNSYTVGSVTGNEVVGGLAGFNQGGSITNSYAASDVTGQEPQAGGLVGQNDGGSRITNSYATGDVKGESILGGLVGYNQGRVMNSYATGDVEGVLSLGGLVGVNDNSITNSYAAGDVTGESNVGDLVGSNRDGTITNSSPQSTKALQAPTTATGIYSGWSTADWDFGSALQYPRIRYATGSDPNNPACGIAGQPSCGVLLPNQIPISSDASLSALVISAGTLNPTFASNEMAYSVSVVNSTQTITVTPSSDANAIEITVNDGIVVSGSPSNAIPLVAGDVTTITIEVTAQDRTTNTYVVTVNRDPSSDASLSALEVSEGSLMPVFMSDTLSYTVGVANATQTITVTPVTTNPNATITVDGRDASESIDLTEGDVTTITVVVTAQDDNTMEAYTIAVTRLAPPLSSDASLSALMVSAGTLMPTFMGDTLSYTVEVANVTPTITVTPTASDANVIEITVNGERVGSGNASQSIALTEGDTTEITIVVTAQDSTTNTYTIAVTRGLLPSCTQTIPDTDDDGVSAVLDIDKDGDGLIELCDLEGLDAIRHQLDGSGYRATSTATLITTGCPSDDDGCHGYELVRSLDFDDAGSYGSGRIDTAWTTSTGWLPIGSQDQPFGAIFEGNDQTISNLTIDRPDEDHIGLFGYTGTSSMISNIGLLDVFIRGNDQVGGLVGHNGQGRITNSYAAGAVTGENIIGGLVGLNFGSITNSYATGEVTGNSGSVGGLVGRNLSSITNSYARGDVRGQDTLGGLVGWNRGVITNSYATGAVTGEIHVGGLAGSNWSSITNSYATGDVTGNQRVGGLVGTSESEERDSIITNSYATGDVDGSRLVGGLVGINAAGYTDQGVNFQSSITNSYATGDVTGVQRVGGLVGFNEGGSFITNSYATGDVTGESNVDDLVGLNESDIINSSPQSTEALQAPTTATGIYSGWSTADWDFGNSLQYPTLKYAIGPDENNPACDTAGQPNCGALLPNQIPISSDASLSALVISAGTLNPAFASNQVAYSVSVANTTTTVTVTPSSDANAIEITVNGQTVGSGTSSSAIALTEGDFTAITIIVTAQDSTTNTYTIAVGRGLSNDASLSALEVSAGTLMPAFMSDTLSYTVSVANATPTIIVTPVTTNLNATITVDDADVISGMGSAPIQLIEGEVTTITVVVTAQDDNTMETYTIAVTRLALPLSSDASLRDLTVSAGTLIPAFMSDTLSYTVEVANAIDTITVIPTATNANTTITVNDETVGSGSTSNAISLIEGGITTIRVEVTAQDSTTNTYTIAVSRELDPSSTILPSCTQTIPDVDNDGVSAALDIDKDGDGLIELCDLEGLNAIRHQLDGSGYRVNSTATLITTGCPSDGDGCRGYELVQSLDFAEATSYRNGRIDTEWTTGTGWLPIGSRDEPFNAIFEGNGHTISNLMINRPSDIDIGLFGETANNSQIANIGLLDVDITGDSNVGGLVGDSRGSITNSYATGDVTGHREDVGGLVGQNIVGNITNSYATGDVRGVTRTGGLVGFNQGRITNSYATGRVTGDWVGGLVGVNTDGGSITNSYARGDVDGSENVGGLVGLNSGGNITNSYATGDVTGQYRVGGLVGLNNGGSITNSSPQSTAALQAPTTATGIYSQWSTANWNFGSALQYPTLKYAAGSDPNNPACGTAGQPSCGALLPNQIPISSDASLSALTVSAGTLNPAFARNEVTYSVSVANSTQTITVTPSSDANATITVETAEVETQTVESGTTSTAIPLAEGEVTTITVVVTAQDGTINTYTIAVSRLAPLSSDASLSDLTVSAGTLMPVFNSTTLNYTVSVANNIEELTVTPTASDDSATITVETAEVETQTVESGTTSTAIPLAAGEVTMITIVVTAQDGTMKENYTIAVRRLAAPLSNDASLSALEVSAGTLSPDFNRTTLNYTVSVRNDIERL